MSADDYQRLLDRTRQKIYDLSGGGYLAWGSVYQVAHRQHIAALDAEVKLAAQEKWAIPKYQATLDLLFASHLHLRALYQLREKEPPGPLPTAEQYLERLFPERGKSR